LKYKVLKSFFDILFAFFAIIILLPLLAFIFVLLWINLKTNPIFVQIRPGYKGKLFKIYKFKTMRDVKPEVGLTDFERITKIGGFLRKLSLDELPQLFNVVFGQMSFVGPRPALFNQYDLIDLRTKAGVEMLLPGLTGWAQVQGRDNLSLAEKLSLDIEYLKKRSFLFDVYIISKTFWRILDVRSVSH